MAAEKKLIVGAINITIQPHSAQRYLDLFRMSYNLKKPAKIKGDHYALLSGLRKLDRKQEEPGAITGDIFRYTDIDANLNWFNTDTNDFASEDEVEGIRIPDNLKPNSSRFSYIFYPEEHILFYEGYYDGHTFGAQNAANFFDNLFNTEDLFDKFGRVDVTHIPQIDSLSEALAIPHKRRIDLTVKRPNPDDLADAERDFLQRMTAKNVELVEQSFTAIQGSSIEIDDELRTMAKISAKNGKVEISGKDTNFKPIKYSTKSHPMRTKEYYDSDSESAFELLGRIAVSMRETIKQMFNQ